MENGRHNNPLQLDKHARRYFIRDGVDRAAAADAALKCWGDMPGAAYRAKSGVEDAISNMYWEHVCNNV